MWNKTSEVLPDHAGACLVFRGRIEWAFYNSIGKFCGPNSFLRDVTHWMPLPAPPTAEKKKLHNYFFQRRLNETR